MNIYYDQYICFYCDQNGFASSGVHNHAVRADSKGSSACDGGYLFVKFLYPGTGSTSFIYIINQMINIMVYLYLSLTVI